MVNGICYFTWKRIKTESFPQKDADGRGCAAFCAE